WQDRAVVILDSRRSAHAGTGPSSSFEFAVSAAASIGVHLARSGLDGHLLTDAGPLAGPAMFEDILLDALSVVTTSRNHDFARTTTALSTIEGGLLVLIAGRLSGDAARETAIARRHGRQGIAMLLAVTTWAAQPERNGEVDQPSRVVTPGKGNSQSAGMDAQVAAGAAVQDGVPDHQGQQTENGRRTEIGQGTQNARGTQNGHLGRDGREGPRGHGPELVAATAEHLQRAAPPAQLHPETAAAAAVLRAAGWRVITVDAATPLAVAWQQLPHAFSSLPVSQAGFGAGR